MKRVTDAYARALFPNRYGAAREQDGTPMGIAADTLDLNIAAAVYRAVSAVESLLARLRRRARSAESGLRGARRAPTATPLGCS